MGAVKFVSNKNSLTYAKLPKILDICKAMTLPKSSTENLSAFWSTSENSNYWFSRSAESIAFLAEAYKERYKVSKLSIWVPEYFCNEALQFLRRNEVDIVFYPVDLCGMPNISEFQTIDSSNKPDIFVIVHFFGSPSDSNQIEKFCKKNQSWIVEDAAHVLEPNFGIGGVGDFVIYSPHKHFAIPDGAICIARINGPSSLLNDEFKNILENLYLKLVSPDKFINNSTLLWILKRIFQKFGIRVVSSAKPYIEMTPKHSHLEVYGDQKPFSSMTGFAKNMLAHELKRVDEDRGHRLLNMAKWADFFNKNSSGAARIVNSNIGTPYLCCVEFDDISLASSMYKKLQISGLPVMTWPDLPLEVSSLGDKSKANLMRLTRIFLPVHTYITKENILNHENKLKAKSNNFIANELFNKNDWDKYWLMSTKKSLTQAWEYGEAKVQSEGWEALRLLLTDEKNLPIGLCQVLTKKIGGIFKIARINKGPIALGRYDFEDKNILPITSAICAELRSRGYWVTQIAPLFEPNPSIIKSLNSLRFRKQNICPADSAMLDLSRGEDCLINTFSSKWRSSLRKGQKLEYKISIGLDQNKLLPILLELYKTQQIGKRYTGTSSEMIKALIDNQTEFFKVNIFIAFKCSIFEKESILGALVTIQYGNISEYLIGITNDEGRISQANSVLLWHAICHAINNGCNLFDIGGLNALTPDGIARYKNGLRGTPYRLIGEWRRWF